MANSQNPVNVLDPAQCMELLRTQTVGRIVTHVGDVVDIFPVNYVADGESIVFRTAEGTKLLELVISSEVLFEADHHESDELWSVVVRGTARVLDTEAEIHAAEALPLKPLVPTLKRNFVRIDVRSVTGRAFRAGEEPRRDGPQPY